MNMKNLVMILACSVLALADTFGRDMPVMNGRLESDLNANGHSITNLPSPSSAGEAANKAYVDGGISSITPESIGAIRTETDPTVPEWAKRQNPPSFDETDPFFTEAVNGGMTVSNAVMVVDPATGETTPGNEHGVVITEKGVSGNWQWFPVPGVGGYYINTPFSFSWAQLVTSEEDPTVPDWAKAANPPASMPNNGLVLTNGVVKTKSGTTITADRFGAVPTTRTVNTKPLSSDITLVASDVGAYSSESGEQLAQDVQVLALHMNAEDVRVVITNYNSVSELPKMSIDYYRTPEGSRTGEWVRVWDEMSRWGWMTNSYLSSNYYNKAEIDSRMDHIPWGVWDSQTGEFSPDSTVQISADRVILCKDASYKRVATTGGSYFVWMSNQPYTLGEVNTNGYFRLEDADGNVTFEIVKGDKVVAAASAGSVRTEEIMGVTHLYIGYPVVADNHPTLEICNDLSAKNWKGETDEDCIANVNWTGSSGDYTAEVWGKSQQSAIFVKGTYEQGSDPYVRYSEALAIQKIKVGNTIYYVDTAVISGHTVLTLSLTPPNH